ncbi:MAG TPA: hypothetical protein VHZ52_07015, partial [Acidobacteriaceae bacterium]|nr:hypothetical protein [Acidobacteriaceae bacterium]
MATSEAQFVRREDRSPIDVFIVSPNTRLRQDIHDKLGPPRWNVIQAGSGAGALELLNKRSNEGGILLLDQTLPDLHASEFHGMVRARFPNFQIMTLNSDTGQLLVGSSSPTSVSTGLVDLINRGGPVSAPAYLAVDGGVRRH